MCGRYSLDNKGTFNVILVLAGFWPHSENSITGIFVVQQVAALVRAGFTVKVVLPMTVGRRNPKPLTPEALGLSSDHVSVVQIAFPRVPEALTAWPGIFTLNVWLAKLFIGLQTAQIMRAGDYRAVIIHGLRYCGLSLSASSKKSPSRIVVMHGCDPFLEEYARSSPVLRAVRAMSSASDSIVLVGEPLREHALAIGLQPDKIAVIPNGTDLPSIDSVSAAQRPMAETRLLLSVSNLVKLKGIDVNLRALAALTSRRPDLRWRYHIVGDGVAAASLRQVAEDLGISDRVVFLGRLDYRRTMQEMSTCDIFSLPSWGEAFGIVYLEAMARMRPAVGCFQNGAEDVITDGEDGCLVAPKDVENLSEVLERLLEDPRLCASLGAAARRTAERFSWDTNVARLLSLVGIRSAPRSP